MELISRSDAREAGARFYFTGKPCRRGHVSERYVSSKLCKDCAYELTKDHAQRNPGYYQARTKERLARLGVSVCPSTNKRQRETHEQATQSRQLWTISQEEKLREMRRNGASFKEAALLLGRSYHACVGRDAVLRKSEDRQPASRPA